MSAKQARISKSTQLTSFYTGFTRLDGSHPFMDAVPEGSVTYRVRELRAGRVAYFNYALAKEMGLIDASHPHEMTDRLHETLISTFSIQIINEYDELSRRRIDPATIKPHPYMATRYLQLQHANKQGKTSGDGRGIWNGIIQNRHFTWDVSSRGTGVTCLAPGAVTANRPLKTGGTEFGYGCGQAEIDELLGAAILAEVMHLQGVPTERVLCVIDLGKGVGIGVRAAPNLLRPAHLYLYLKQERRDELRRAVDYFLERQVRNRRWAIRLKDGKRYDEMARHFSRDFADFTAKLDIDYVFAWLDWDGDNVLADAGIIDYGSVRQFGLRHDRYRYDDIERFSTNLNEQRSKARLIVQVFVQMVDYLKTGQKKPLKSFSAHPTVAAFDQSFVDRRADRLLYRLGFNANQRRRVLENHRDLFDRFDRVFSAFERAKVGGSLQKVADGVNQPPLYNMRQLSLVLTRSYAQQADSDLDVFMPEDEFFAAMLSGYAKDRQDRPGRKQIDRIRHFQRLYKELASAATGHRLGPAAWADLAKRSEELNSENRITGNALIEIVEELMQERRRGLPIEQVQAIIDRLIVERSDAPEGPRHHLRKSTPPSVRIDLYTRLLNIVKDNFETI